MTNDIFFRSRLWEPAISVDFAVRIIKLADALPNSSAGKHIGRQLLRSGTSPAPNYQQLARSQTTEKTILHN